MTQLTGSLGYQKYQRIYEELLKEQKIRFIGFIDYMGNLLLGRFRKGITPLKDDSQRHKIFLEVALIVRTREDFDPDVGPVKYAASRRTRVVMMTFPLMNKILFVSIEPDVEIDTMAKKIVKICGI